MVRTCRFIGILASTRKILRPLFSSLYIIGRTEIMSDSPPVLDNRTRRPGRSRLVAFLALPALPELANVRNAITASVRQAGFDIAASAEMLSASLAESTVGDIARADCVIADLTGRSPSVIFELGAARAMSKQVFLLVQKNMRDILLADLRDWDYVPYEQTRTGISALATTITQLLVQYRRAPRRARMLTGVRYGAPFFVEWERLAPSEFENLCLELLAQMGFRRVDWEKGIPEVDLVAELPKKDPDGFEYSELWLVSLGRKVPGSYLLEMAQRDPDYIIHRLGGSSEERLGRLLAQDPELRITLLVISIRDSSELELLGTRKDWVRPSSVGRSVRFRLWNRPYLTSLVQQFPQIGYKYFSDEGRSRSKYRKTPEELYNETVLLSERLRTTVAAYEEEKNKRVRAERDAVWKDISFSAAHKIGNPIFAIETIVVHPSRTGQVDQL